MAQNKSMKQQGVSSKAAKAKIAQAVVEKIAEKVRSSQPKKKARAVGSSQTSIAPFKGVTTMELAPVSIGNTIRAAKPKTVSVPNGIRVVGRDYVMAIGGQSVGVTGWALVGGFSLSPMALNASALRGFFQSYERFRWNKCNLHFITSSPTSLPGDILMVYHSNHGGPKVDHSSSNFLSYALSTDAAVLGPQWTNHTVPIIEGIRDWLNTDVLNAEDVTHQADGEVLVYAKGTTNGTAADSPGYLLIDYDVTFERRMLNPRVQTLPSSLFKWFNSGFRFSSSVNQWDTVTFDLGSTNSYTGVAIGPPPGLQVGDIFQIVLDTSLKIESGVTFATGMSYVIAYSGNLTTSSFAPATYAVTNGCTLYALCASAAGNGSFSVYPSYDAVFAGNSLRWANTNASQNLTCPGALCCVGSANPAYLQANIG